VEDSGTKGVLTPRGFVRSKYVVVAEGIKTPSLLEPLGIRVPIDLVQGQILVTAPMDQIIRYPSRDIRQTSSGNILLGTTQDKVGLNYSTTIDSAYKISSKAINTFWEL
jgi:sarcosine oxidase subunit beta